MNKPNQPPPPPGEPLEQRVRHAVAGAASQVESDLKRLVAYINDEVVPEVRRNGSVALKQAAAEIDRLARRMDSDGRPPRA